VTADTENENTLINAEVDEANAPSAADTVRKEVIENFDADVRKSYDDALDDLNKATKDWQPTGNEKRATYDALEKHLQTAASTRQKLASLRYGHPERNDVSS
jgi:hypothetical protein